MKTLGLIGGMSWESTATYYRLINLGVKARLGGHHSAKILLNSVDFAEIELLQKTNRWEEAGRLLGTAAQSLERAGAECVVLCTNTMHKVAPAIEAAVSIPLLHIAGATADAIRAAGLDTIGLLATRFTMEGDFYVPRLRDSHRLNVIVPKRVARNEVHRIIYEELVHGVIRDESRATLLNEIAELKNGGAQGIVLGCTEISMLVESSLVAIPVFDTTAIHAARAVTFSLQTA